MGITIGGAAYDNWLNRGSLTHTSTYGPEPDQLSFMLNPGSPVPAVSSDVVYTLPDGERLFGGVYTGAPESLRGFMAPGLAVGCLDWRIRADALTLNDRFYDATAGEIIVQLFKRYAPQFDTSMVNLGGIKIPQIRFKRDSKITAALEALSNLTGWVWDIDPLRRVLWGPPGSVAAPFTMSDTSRNFEDLVVEVNRDQLRNRIIVRGGSTPSSVKTIDRFAGDGLRSSWPLTAIPHGLESYELFKGDFGSGISPSDWVETDVVNPAPPAGHPNAAGYLITTAQTGAVLSQTGWLQILGGNSAWGAVRLMAFQVLGRGDGRRFEWEFSAGSAVGQGRCGLWDPNQQGALAGELYGFYFDNGTIKPSIGGVAQAAANAITYVANTLFRLRIIPKAGGGATMWVNKDATGNMALPEAERVAWRASQWVLLFDTATGNAANFAFCGIFNHSFVGRMRRARAFNRLYGAKLLVGGVEKVVGLLRVDEDSGCDALVGTTTGDLPVLSFFPDTRPANGVAGQFEYFEGIPVHVQVSDPDSIAALAAIENDPLVPLEKRGVVEHYIEDASITTRKMAIARGKQDLEQFANALVNLTFRTRATGLRAGQVFNAALTKPKTGRELAGAFLIQQVVTASKGSGNFEATVAASSRLKGIQDYLLELLALGRRMDMPQDDNSPIEDLIFAGDTLNLAEAFSVSGPAVTGADGLEFVDLVTLEAGPAGPYYYETAEYGLAVYLDE